MTPPSTASPADRAFRSVTTVIAPAALGLALLTLLRLYEMTGWNRELTVAALGVVDQTQLLLATLLGSIPFVALAGAAVSTSIIVRQVLLRRHESNTSPARPSSASWWSAPTGLVGSTLALVVTLPLGSIFVGVQVVATTIVLTFVVTDLRQRTRTRPPRTALGRATLVLVQLVVILPIVAFGMVLLYGALFTLDIRPSERITTADTVYDRVWVMGEQDGRTLLMNDQQDARWVDSDSIVKRQICEGDPDARRSDVEPLQRRVQQERTATNLEDYADCAP